MAKIVLSLIPIPRLHVASHPNTSLGGQILCAAQRHIRIGHRSFHETQRQRNRHKILILADHSTCPPTDIAAAAVNRRRFNSIRRRITRPTSPAGHSRQTRTRSDTNNETSIRSPGQTVDTIEHHRHHHVACYRRHGCCLCHHQQLHKTSAIEQNVSWSCRYSRRQVHQLCVDQRE